MADVRPFAGVRYDEARVGDLSRVLCPPYDVISADQQAALHARSPHNIVRLELGEDRPDDGATENRYARAGRYLRGWLHDGILTRDAEPALYLYEQVFELDGRRRSRAGVLAAVRLHTWDERVILPHEATMAAPKEDRLRLLRATAANISPVMALYDDPSGAMAQALSAVWQSEAVAVARVGAPGEQHVLRRCTDRAAIRAVAEALRDRRLYIADGHHRYETALFYRDERVAQSVAAAGEDAAWNFVLMLLIDFNDPGLVVLATHRLVRGMDEPQLRAVLTTLEHWFEVEPLGRGHLEDATVRWLSAPTGHAGAVRGAALALYLRGELFRLTLRAASGWEASLARDRTDAWRSLDVAMADTLVLGRACGIGEQDRAAGEAIGYTRDAHEAVARVDQGSCQLAVLLRPTPVTQVRAVADAGDKMPQKSTYFYPKPMTGLVLHGLDERR